MPLICEPLTSQPIVYAKENCDCSTDLDLADCACEDDRLSVDILVRSNSYWKLVTGEIINERISNHNSTNLVVMHTVAVDIHVSQDGDQELDKN